MKVIQHSVNHSAFSATRAGRSGSDGGSETCSSRLACACWQRLCWAATRRSAAPNYRRMATEQTSAARGQVSRTYCAVRSIPAGPAHNAAVVAAVVQGPVTNRHSRTCADLGVAAFALGSAPGQSCARCCAVSAAQAFASFSSEWTTPSAADQGAPRFVAAHIKGSERKKHKGGE